jgi:hypothetical protein
MAPTKARTHILGIWRRSVSGGKVNVTLGPKPKPKKRHH